MKGAIYNHFGGPEVLELATLPDPQAGSREIVVAVHAAGVNQTDCTRRKGLLGGELPQTVGYDVAGVVTSVGEGVTDVVIGDRVFGFSEDGAAAAELARVRYYAPIPPSLEFVEAAVLPVALETATRSLDALKVGPEKTLLINGAAGGIGATAVQLAVARGARVIGIDAPETCDYLRSLGAQPVSYGVGFVERVRRIVPKGVDLALDVAGSGVLPELIELAGVKSNVVTIADHAGAQKYGVAFNTGSEAAGRAVHVLGEIGELIEAGRFALRVGGSYPLSQIAEAHRVSESGQIRGKLALLID
jgi:NADPH:quinone reductase-like Zn-dependent oxidoreductase